MRHNNGVLPGLYPFNGLIDEIIIYSKALTAEEIKQLYEAKRAKFIEYKQGNLSLAIEFDGVDDWVEVPHSKSLMPQQLSRYLLGLKYLTCLGKKLTFFLTKELLLHPRKLTMV
jgi:hypothetical protein